MQERPEELDEHVVLVTAFGAFPGQLHNPTEHIVDELAGQDHVVSHVLDVSYRRCGEQLDTIASMVHPMAVVCFGVAADARAIRVETLAHNLDDAVVPDVDGDVRTGRSIDSGPPSLRTRLPVRALVDALTAAGIPVEESDDPGRYVCNHLFRHVLRSPELAGIPVGFVHVPDQDADGFSAERIALAGQIVVDTVAAHARGEV